MENFRHRLRRLHATRKRIEKLYKSDKILLKDVHILYEAMFLRAVTLFEEFLENLLFSIVRSDRTIVAGKTKSHVRFSSDSAMRRIMFGGKKYIDLLPFEKAEKIASLYLKKGHAFSVLSENDKTSLTKISKVRNAIAHSSRHARQEFESHVIRGLVMLAKDKKPAAYLRFNFRSSPNQSWFEYHLAELAIIAGKLY